MSEMEITVNGIGYKRLGHYAIQPESWDRDKNITRYELYQIKKQDTKNYICARDIKILKRANNIEDLIKVIIEKHKLNES